MSFLINPYSFAGFTPPDFSGYNLTRIYATFKTSEATIDYALKIENSDGSDSRYVFFDEAGEISSTSKISTTTTPHATQDVQYWVDNLMSGTAAYVSSIFCQITAHELSQGTSASANIYNTTGGYVTKNGKPAIRLNGIDGFYGTALSELNDGNSYTVNSVTSQVGAVGTEVGLVFATNQNTGPSNAARQTMLNDNRSAKTLAFFRNTTPTNYTVSLDSPNPTTNQKRLGITLSGTTLTGYYNGSSQTDVETIAGTQGNLEFILGSQGAAHLDGQFQFLGIHDSALSGANMSNFDSVLDEYFSF